MTLSAQAHKEHDSGHDQAAPAAILAPGYHSLTFTAPAAGSYSLPVLFQAADGQVLDSDGNRINLQQLLGDKYVLLSFIYTSCDDVNGCPLATYVLGQVQKRIVRETSLKDVVRMISISFDSERDTPAVMKNYAAHFNPAGFDWRFLTTASERELQPLLKNYNQSVSKATDEHGNETGNIAHILRVLLLDKQGAVRNIYSVAFLHADTLINDLKTLQISDSSTARKTPLPPSSAVVRPGAGDDKTGYERDDYRTQSKSLSQRTGRHSNLLAQASHPPSGLDKPDIPADNPLTAAKVLLGRQLFFDRRLSHNNTISCAMCHIPEQGFTSQELATAVGMEGRTVRRNAPTLYNIAYAKRLFHDAREFSLEQQIWSPLLAHNEMANPAIGHLLHKLRTLPDYRQRFAEIFPDEGVTMATLGKALASYQRTLISANSTFDRWYYGKEADAMTEEAIAGFRLFTGKANCIHCHSIGKKTAMFTDHRLHNTGIGYRASMYPPPRQRHVHIAPGATVTIDTAAITSTSETRPGDLGYYEISGDPADRWKYRTPTLRNIALTAPYMHDGSLATLSDVIAFYNRGGVSNDLLDPLLRPLGLDAAEAAALLAFLHALTGDNIETVISDAFAQPVGNVE